TGGRGMPGRIRRVVGAAVSALVVAGVVAVAPGVPAGADSHCDKTWANTATSGVWDDEDVVDATEAQWSPPGVPSVLDIVCLPAGDYTVEVRPTDGADGAPGAEQVAAEVEVGAGARLIVRSPGAPASNDDVRLTVNGAVTTAGDVEVRAG